MTLDELRLKHSPLELSQGKIEPVSIVMGWIEMLEKEQSNEVRSMQKEN